MSQFPQAYHRVSRNKQRLLALPPNSCPKEEVPSALFWDCAVKAASDLGITLFLQASSHSLFNWQHVSA